MRSLRTIPLLLLLAPFLRAEDEVALVLSRSPFCLVGQTVTVSVGAGMSMVEGQYEFKYVPRLDSLPPSETVSFEFAVLVPKEIDRLDALTEITQFKLHAGSATFDPADFGLLPVGPTMPALIPEGTRIMVVTFQLPRPVLQKQVALRVTYFQPHYRLAGQEVAAYLPLLPDFEAFKNELLFSRDDFAVGFEPVGAVRLRRLSVNAAVMMDTPQAVKVHPVDREIIALAVEPAAAAPKTPPAKPGPAPR